MFTSSATHKPVPKPIPKKTPFREWLDSVLFAVIAATIIRWLVFSAFVIPTPSMENSLLVGDYLFVSKLHYGTTTPVTPLQVPLTHQTIWGTSIPSYLDWIKLPSYRLPGFTSVKRGDVIVFNLPVEHPRQYVKYSAVLPDLRPHPIDLRSNYIKRCIALPGDVLEVKQGQIYVNGKLQTPVLRIQNEYFISVTTAVNEENVFHKNGITDYARYSETYNDKDEGNDEFGYIVKTTAALAAMLKSYEFVKRVEPVYAQAGLKEPSLFPSTSLINWNRDNYGPLTIPEKDVEIMLDEKNVAFYEEVIRNYEGHDNIVLKNGTLVQDGVPLKSYKFNQDYFFMMGDNRHNSADSRYWGFVPMDHIVGKAVFVWMSVDPNPVNLFNKIRWDRVFSLIE